jgi:hypothetical protein
MQVIDGSSEVQGWLAPSARALACGLKRWNTLLIYDRVKPGQRYMVSFYYVWLQGWPLRLGLQR